MRISNTPLLSLPTLSRALGIAGHAQSLDDLLPSVPLGSGGRSGIFGIVVVILGLVWESCGSDIVVMNGYKGSRTFDTLAA